MAERTLNNKQQNKLNYFLHDSRSLQKCLKFTSWKLYESSTTACRPGE